MARRKDGMRERKCGCIYFEHGPPVKCGKHEAKEQLLEDRSLRRAVAEDVAKRGHKLGEWSEYESLPGKWTAYCMNCGLIAIVYDKPQEHVDQVNSWCFTRDCK